MNEKSFFSIMRIKMWTKFWFYQSKFRVTAGIQIEFFQVYPANTGTGIWIFKCFYMEIMHHNLSGREYRKMWSI